MHQFILQRLKYGILVQLLAIIGITSLIYLSPVDPSRLTFGQRADAGTLRAKRTALGLDAPLPLQLVWYLNDLSPLAWHAQPQLAAEPYSYVTLVTVAQSSFVLQKPYLRTSFQTGRQVSSLLAAAIPKTAILAILAMLGATILGVGLGVVAALRRNSWLDSALNGWAVLGVSLPSYVVSLLLAFAFAYLLRDYTGLPLRGGLYEIDAHGVEYLAWRNVVLPAIALGMRPVALILSLTRAAMLEVLALDYVRTARAKGLPERLVILKHALRNALNPIVTAISGWLAGLLTGAFFVETVFGYDGVGSLTVNALLNYDLPVVLGTVLFSATVFIILNLITDLLQYWLDPRLRLL